MSTSTNEMPFCGLPLLSVRTGNWQSWNGQLYAELPYIDVRRLDRYVALDGRIREGSGAVAEGRMARGTFVADNILAKHDERYMPPELGNLAAERKAEETLER